MCYSGRSACPGADRGLPGSVWVCNSTQPAPPRLWSDDLPGDCPAGVLRLPCSSWSPRRVDAPVTFTYQRAELDVRLEVVDAGMRDALAGLFRCRT